MKTAFLTPLKRKRGRTTFVLCLVGSIGLLLSQSQESGEHIIKVLWETGVPAAGARIRARFKESSRWGNLGVTDEKGILYTSFTDGSLSIRATWGKDVLWRSEEKKLFSGDEATKLELKLVKFRNKDGLAFSGNVVSSIKWPLPEKLRVSVWHNGYPGEGMSGWFPVESRTGRFLIPDARLDRSGKRMKGELYAENLSGFWTLVVQSDSGAWATVKLDPKPGTINPGIVLPIEYQERMFGRVVRAGEMNLPLEGALVEVRAQGAKGPKNYPQDFGEDHYKTAMPQVRTNRQGEFLMGLWPGREPKVVEVSKAGYLTKTFTREKGIQRDEHGFWVFSLEKDDG